MEEWEGENRCSFIKAKFHIYQTDLHEAYFSMKILLLILLHLCNRNIRMEQKRSEALKLSSCTFSCADSEAAHLGD